MKRWGRTKVQLVCKRCRNLIEEGEPVYYLEIGQGVECVDCAAPADDAKAAA